MPATRTTAGALAGALRLPRGHAPMRLEGLAPPLVLPQDGELAEALAACLHGWRLAPAAAEGPALAAVTRRAGGSTYASAQDAAPLPGLTVTEAVCALVAEASVAAAAAMPGAVGLHAGGVVFGDRLVALTGHRRAGKSTLVARLSAEPDLATFCDDVLPVTAGGEGVALGVPPRLRLPLPAGIAPGFRAHAARHLVLADARYGYLRAPTLVPHGTRARLGALVLLNRGAPGSGARLWRLSPAAALFTVVEQSLTGPEEAGAALARARALMAGVPALRLDYADLEDAVALLRRAFAGRGFLPDDLPEAPAEAPEPPRVRLVGADRRLRPAPGVSLRRQQGGAFLWRPGEVTLWRLNPVALAAWTLMAEGLSARAMAAALAEVFPDAPPPVILRDLRGMLGRFLAEGFAEPC